MEEVSAEKAGASGSSAKADEQAIHLPCKVQKVTNKNKKGLKKSRIRRGTRSFFLLYQQHRSLQLLNQQITL